MHHESALHWQGIGGFLTFTVFILAVRPGATSFGIKATSSRSAYNAEASAIEYELRNMASVVADGTKTYPRRKVGNVPTSCNRDAEPERIPPSASGCRRTPAGTGPGDVPCRGRPATECPHSRRGSCGGISAPARYGQKISFTKSRTNYR